MHIPRLKKLLFSCIIAIIASQIFGKEGAHGILFNNDCSFDFKNQSFGVLTSPGYPQAYKGNILCIWSIEMEKGARIALSIRKFNLRPNDLLTISEPATDDKQSLARLDSFTMNNQPKEVIFSDSNIMNVQLVAGGNNAVNTAFGNRTFYAIFEKEACGGLLQTSEGYIETPTYIHLTSMMRECVWSIVAPKGQTVLLTFLQFDFPPGSCLFNSLYIRDGSEKTGDLIDSFCEENPPMSDLHSSLNGLNIAYRVRPNFLATQLVATPKVKMHYEFVDACGGLVEGIYGSFSFPKSGLGTNDVCQWTIHVPQSNGVQLKLKQFEVEAIANGGNEILTIYDGMQNDSSIVWSSKDGGSPPLELFSRKNNMIIELRRIKNSTVSSKIVFKAFYSAVQKQSWASNGCIQLEDRELFGCSSGHYIECGWRCDGIPDCPHGQDELSCPADVTHLDVNHFKAVESPKELGYLVLIFALTGSAALACLLTIAIDRLCREGLPKMFKQEREQNSSGAQGVYPEGFLAPPPYTEIDPSITVPPPPYQIAVISERIFSEALSLQDRNEEPHRNGEQENNARDESVSYTPLTLDGAFLLTQ